MLDTWIEKRDKLYYIETLLKQDDLPEARFLDLQSDGLQHAQESADNIIGVRFGVGYVDVRRRTSTYVDVRGRTSTYVDVRRRTTYVDVR